MGSSGAMARMAASNYQMAGQPFGAALDQQSYAAEQEALAQEEQGRIAEQEAALYAEQKTREAGKFAQQQALNYSASGVLLEGTPAQVLNETRNLAAQEVEAILKQGAAQGNLARRKAGIVRSSALANRLGDEAKFKTAANKAYLEEMTLARGTGLTGLLGQALLSLGKPILSAGLSRAVAGKSYSAPPVTTQTTP